MGGYVNQTGASYVQQDIGYVGVVGIVYVRRLGRLNVVRERENLVAMATLKLEQTKDDVRQSAEKAFREDDESQAGCRRSRSR